MNVSKISELYENVLFSDIFHFQLREDEVRQGIEIMNHVYNPESADLTSARSNVANYNNPAHRCAYLHKYAAFHTTMVRDSLCKAIRAKFRIFYDLVFSPDTFSVCCLGGGPGNDVIAVLAALHNMFSYFPTSATIVDYMEDWKYSFNSIIRELGSGLYGAFGNNTFHFLSWRYLGANLLKSLTPEVQNSISTASLITMIKFASATSCKDTGKMINNVFLSMKPGAMLLFIDNDGGGYRELVMKAAKKYNFISVYGPQRQVYDYPEMKIKRFGYASCTKSTVTVHIVQKPLDYDYRVMNSIKDNYSAPTLISPPNRWGLGGSPLTPFIYDAVYEQSFCDDEASNKENFELPEYGIPQSPDNVMPSLLCVPADNSLINTPMYGTPVNAPISKKARRGCIPRIRNHINKRLQNVKYHTKKFFQTKSKKKLFEL